jgi:serine/threonine-protein kinase
MTEATQTNVNPTSAEPAVSLDLTGRTLGDYYVLRRLGSGGMGEVYVAEQRTLKRKVALKILRPDLAANPTALKRFKLEAEAVAKATHANIVQVYACDSADGITYMALEYVEGRNLKDYITKKGPPDILLAISFMRQIAAALQRASELGIIHRDIKPENILVTRKGEVKVADFGLSRVLDDDHKPVSLTQSGVTMGTPLYMAPEQVEGQPLDPRTDIYSFGVTCYHMMAGEPPFTGKTPFEVALAHVRAEAEPLQMVRPDLPEAFCAVIHKMMAKVPADRYQTCRELLRDLSKVRESISGQTTAHDGNDFDVALVAEEEMAESTPATIYEETQRAVNTPSPAAAPRRGWTWLIAAVAALTIMMAVGSGAALALVRWVWVEQLWAVSAPADQPLDSPDLEAVVSAQKREQKLRDAAEEYLNPQSAARNPQAGFGLCMDLGLFYLEQNKLDDADKWFTRLDNMRRVDSYHVLGHVGRAIVLALRNQSKDSNDLFKEVFRRPEMGPRPGIRRLEPHVQMFQNPQMRYWLAEAIYYNQKGGVSRSEMPQGLVRFADPTAAPRQ